MNRSRQSKRSTATVAARASFSISICQPLADSQMSDEHQARTILVPLDMTPAGEVKVPVAETYARALEADVLLLHVLRPGTLDPANVSSDEALARTYLDTFGARLRSAGISAEGVIRAGPPAATILQEALIRDV